MSIVFTFKSTFYLGNQQRDIIYTETKDTLFIALKSQKQMSNIVMTAVNNKHFKFSCMVCKPLKKTSQHVSMEML